MSNKNAILNIRINHLENQRFDSIILEGKRYELKENLSIEIKFNEFESDLYLKVVNLELIRRSKNVVYYFEVIPGINNAILFNGFGKTRDLIFNENKKIEVKIEKDEKSLEVIDISKTKRIILINLSQNDSFFINGVDLVDEIIDISTNKSLQVSILNLEKKIFQYKIISSEKYDAFFEKMEKYEKDSKEFFDEIQQIIENKKILNKEEINDKLKNINYLSDILDTKFNFSKKIMLKYFNSNNDLDFISNCCLFRIVEKYLSKKDVFLNELKNIFDFYHNYKLNLEKDINLNIYQKILVLIEFTHFFIEKDENIFEFKSSKFSYYSKKTMEINSPLLSSINFLKNFIEDLDESYPLFIPLILIDNGKFIYNGENMYAFDLNSKEKMKKYLTDIIYETIIVYEDYNSDKGAETNKNTGVVSLNLSETLVPEEIIDIGKNIEDENIRINYSLKIILALSHEIKIVNIKSNKEDEDITKIIREEDCNGEWGYFLKYFFGECKYGYIINLIEKMIMGKVNLNLLYDKKLWKEEIDILKKYIELKFLIFHENKDLLKDMAFYKNIKEEISYLENIIKSNNIEFKFLGKKMPNPIIYRRLKIKRKKILIDAKESENYEEEIDYEYYRKKPIEELKKILNDEELPFDVYAKLYKIYSKKLRKQ